MALTAGSRLGHYIVGAPLGAGGMGEVYRATDTKLGRDVALKILPDALASDPDMVERFRREARAVAALNHPHVVTIHSVEEAPSTGSGQAGIQFLTMELVDGQSVDRLIAKGPLDVERILDIADALAEALAAAHEAGIVHRDLKPANVMVTRAGVVKVLDFGLARFHRLARTESPADQATVMHTNPGVVLGTGPYMSPEQIQAGPVDHRTDLFSLGVVLYEMATGRRPFSGVSAAGLFAAILRDPTPPVMNQRPDLPPALADVITRCLEKDAGLRFQTARDLASAVRGSRLAQPRSAAPTPSAGEQPATRADESFRVAVLPFKYTGANPDLVALAEGLSEEIVTGLSRFSYLRVGRAPGARYVIEGSLRSAGAQLRVAVQVVDAMTGAHLWAQTYDRAFSATEIFAMQDDLVPRIVSTVADAYGVLPRTMSQAVRHKDSLHLTPYEALLRSFSYAERVTADDHAEAKAALEQAVEQAPGFADCWAMLSILLTDEHIHGFAGAPDALERALHAARQAVDVGATNHKAHQALAWALFFRREFRASRVAAERTLALNPMDACAAVYMGQTIAFGGSSDEDWRRGCELVTRGIALNPNHPGWYWYAPYLDAYRREDYRAALDIAFRMNMPGFHLWYVALAAAHGQLGEREAGGKAVADLLSRKPDYPTAARQELLRIWEPELVDHLIDGLRKAGLDVVRTRHPAVASPAVEAAQPSIAVLPFANLSADPENQYFSDGLSEEIINALTRLAGLRVIARTSAFRFRGEQDVRKVGEALGVRTVLEGSVRRAGGRLRITAQLVNTADQSHIWSERFDRELVDVFAIQDEISSAIVEKLHVSLGAGRKALGQTKNVSAYDALLEARHYFSQFTPQGAERALDSLRRALALEPDYPDALVLHALYHVMRGYMFDDPRNALPEAQALAARALAVDPHHGEALAAVATVAAWMDRDWTASEGFFRRALAVAPASARVHELYGLLGLLGSGRLDEALSELDRAVELDPLSALYAGNRGRVLTCSRRFAEAEASCRRGLGLDPGQLLVQVELIYALAFQGKFEEAEAMGRRAIETLGRTKAHLHALAVSLALSGKRDEVLQLLDENAGSGPYRSPLTRGLVHAVFADMDAAFEDIERAFDERDPLLMYLTVHPMFDALRPDPRYTQLVRRMNL